MAAPLKFLIGLALALAAGWIEPRPARPGRGVRRSCSKPGPRAMIEVAEVPGVAVRFNRDPLSREAVITDSASRGRTEVDKRILREGMGDLKGIDGRMMLIPGVSGVRWEESD